MAKLTADEEKAFKAVFDEFDVNKDGHITSSELKTVLNKLGENPSDEEVAEFVKACDKDKNGTIEFNEFGKYLSDRRRKIFSEIDADGSGYITPDELVVAFGKLGVTITLDVAKEIVKEGDTDCDGKISYAEFVKSIQARPII